MADTPKTPKAPKAKADRPPSARRLAAAEAYNKQFGRAPTKSMTISAMENKVASLARERQYQQDKMRIVDASGLGGSGQKPLRPLDPPIAATPTPQPKTRFQDAYDRASPEKQAKMRESLAGLQKSLGEARNTINKILPPKPAVDPRYSAVKTAPVTNDMQMGMSSSAPVPPGGGRMARVGQFVSEHGGKINTGLAVIGTAGAAARGYADAKAAGKGTGDAVVEGAKSAAIPAALAVGSRVGKPMMNAGKAMLHAGGEIMSSGGGFTDWMLSFPVMKAGLAVGAAGGATWTAGAVLHTAGKVAAPAIAGYQAYQGYKEDGVRGAVKGAVTAFDPTELARVAGAKQGVVGWGFDKAFGSKGAQAALPAPKQQAFAKANADFNHDMSGHASQAEPSGAGKRGWANPANQAAAQEARGVKNVTDWARR